MAIFIHQKSTPQAHRLGMSRISIAFGLCALFAFVAWQFHLSNSRIGNASETKSITADSATLYSVSDKHTPSDRSTSQFPVVIRKPKAAPRVDTGIIDAQGASVSVSCSTCHANRKPNQDNKVAADLDEFHQGMTLAHGKIACLACHNSNDYDSLKLADGAKIEFQDVMALCSQCHGTQRRDFDHGAHGGMTGHWDLNRGSRTRNNCVDCHHPHRPQFPKMQPTFKPRDRFLSPTKGVSDEH